MKSINTILIVAAISGLFLVWNYKAIFGKKPAKMRMKSMGMRSMKTRKSTGDPAIASKAMGEAMANEEETEKATVMILSEILSLNRAAHVLTRSGSFLDKLLKMDQVKACESLIRDYELSSVMVLIKREKHHDHDHDKDGFKKIDAIEGKKITEEQKEKTIKVNTENVNPTDHKDHHEHHHHTTNDPLRIALFCKNLGRAPRIGRVVKTVESENDHDQKYIIELIK
jgi:hypothetical protein